MRKLEVYISCKDTTSATFATINEAMEVMRSMHSAGLSPILYIITKHYEYKTDFYTSTERTYFYNRLNQLDSLQARSYFHNGKSGRSYSSYWHKDKLAMILGL